MHRAARRWRSVRVVWYSWLTACWEGACCADEAEHAAQPIPDPPPAATAQKRGEPASGLPEEPQPVGRGGSRPTAAGAGVAAQNTAAASLSAGGASSGVAQERCGTAHVTAGPGAEGPAEHGCTEAARGGSGAGAAPPCMGISGRAARDSCSLESLREPVPGKDGEHPSGGWLPSPQVLHALGKAENRAGAIARAAV